MAVKLEARVSAGATTHTQVTPPLRNAKAGARPGSPALSTAAHTPTSHFAGFCTVMASDLGACLSHLDAIWKVFTSRPMPGTGKEWSSKLDTVMLTHTLYPVPFPGPPQLSPRPQALLGVRTPLNSSQMKPHFIYQPLSVLVSRPRG